MLRKNPLQPPRPYLEVSLQARPADLPGGPGFVTAEDFDDTGILSGVDPGEPCYWWMPELHGRESGRQDALGGGPETAPLGQLGGQSGGQPADQATIRSERRAPTAA